VRSSSANEARHANERQQHQFEISAPANAAPRCAWSFGMSTSRKTLLLGALVCAPCGLLFAVAIAFWLCGSPLRVRVLDSTFHVISAKVLKRPNDGFYLGNQLEGSIRRFLRHQCHLRIKTLLNTADPISGSFGEGGCTFAVCYSCETPTSLQAELVDNCGAKLQLSPRLNVIPFTTNRYYLLLNLDGERTNAGDYTLKLKGTGVYVAEVEIKGLPPAPPRRHIGPNTF